MAWTRYKRLFARAGVKLLGRLILINLPVTDEDGYPKQQRGVTAYPGLYFVGLSWLHKRKSPLLMGVGEDADFIASHITE